MKHKIIYILSILFLANVSSAQRYKTETFSEVKVTEDLVYGENATIFFQFATGEAIPEELKCDIYEPLDDNLDER